MKSDVDAVAFGVAVSVGAVAIGGVLRGWMRGGGRPLPPGANAKWVKVGSLANITLYPLKSCKGVEIPVADITRLGLVQVPPRPGAPPLRDRYLIVMRGDNGEMVTARSRPRLLQISVSPHKYLTNTLTLSYPGKTDLHLQLPTGTAPAATTRMWGGEGVGCLDCGDVASDWITDLLKDGEEPATQMRIGYWPSEDSSRDIVGASGDLAQIYKGTTNQDAGAFSDLTSYMMMTSSSVDEIRRRSGMAELGPRQFRPNFYVKSNEAPFSELTWKWVRVGDTPGNTFRVVKGCKRCILTTINPDTSEKFPNNEPLRTLNMMEEAKSKEPVEEGPMMGIHLGSFKPGRLQIHDPVYALY